MPDHIFLLGDDTVLVEYGPMRMFIDGSLHGARQPQLCIEGARSAIGFLQEIASQMHSLRAPFHIIAEPPKNLLTHIMWNAAALVGDEDLTPMAAVAGTIADAVADFLEDQGLTKIVVNNGGDLAVRLKNQETLSVGLRPDVQESTLTHSVSITADMEIGGVCTSGLGGRSFTRGIASAATVFATRSAIADAAATAVANATYIPNPAVYRTAAELIDPNTDLRGMDVTTTVGKLAPEEIQIGLAQGIRRAEHLAERGIIKGACVSIKGLTECTNAISPIINCL